MALNLWVMTPMEFKHLQRLPETIRIHKYLHMIHNSSKIGYKVATRSFYCWGSLQHGNYIKKSLP